MNSQHLLMYWLQYRAENYYYMGRFRDAVKTGRKAVAISEELGNQQTRTFASIDLHRSLFQLAEDDEKKMEEGIQPLLRMLEGTDSPDHEALIGRALTDMYRQLEDREAYDHYRSMTLDICKELDDEQDYFQWKQILRELEG